MTNQLNDQEESYHTGTEAIMQTHLDEIDGILARLAGDWRCVPNEEVREYNE
jgi:hypothetical protein